MKNNTCVSRAKSGAFAQQYAQHKDRLVFRLLGMTRNRDVAEDVAAAAFESALANLRSFRGESELATWVNAIAFNELRSRARLKRTVSLDSIEATGSRSLMEPDLLEQIHDRTQCIHRMREVLRRVPSLYRRTLIDHFIDGRSTRQIARQHKIPQGTVLSRIFTGKRFLREAWEA